MTDSLQRAAESIVLNPSIDEKLRRTGELAAAWQSGECLPGHTSAAAAIVEPGRPQLPRLVLPSALPKRGAGTLAGRAARLHALAHIELNAVDLAWDAVYRFAGLPDAYYDDWIGVAIEEAEHFRLLRQRLRDLGYDYGDFDAHNGLWQMAVKTAHDPLVRMALVPRVLEARALEAVPQMLSGLQQAGDNESVVVLEQIMRDEIGHVAAGSRWYNHLCNERGLSAADHWFGLLDDYRLGRVKGPLNLQARRSAGFSEEELDRLGGVAGSGESQ